MTPDSKAMELKTACEWLGISSSGSKSRMFKRLKEFHSIELKRAAIEVAIKEDRAKEIEAVPANLRARKKPPRTHSLALQGLVFTLCDNKSKGRLSPGC